MCTETHIKSQSETRPLTAAPVRVARQLSTFASANPGRPHNRHWLGGAGPHEIDMRFDAGGGLGELLRRWEPIDMTAIDSPIHSVGWFFATQ